MKNLLQTHEVSWAHSVRLALEAEGIEAVILDEQAPGYLSFAGRTRVAVLHDRDFERAQDVLRKMAPPPMQVPRSWRIQKWGLICGVIGLGLLMAAAIWHDDVSGGLELGMALAGLAGMGLGFVLVVVGPRADAPR